MLQTGSGLPSGRVRVKKPHKTKAHRPHPKRRHRHRDAAPILAPHTSRRPTQSVRPDPRGARTQPVRTVGVYRRPGPLVIESRADRRAFRQLLLPFVLMALALAVVPSLHVFPTLKDLIAATPFSAAVQVSEVNVVSPHRARVESIAAAAPPTLTVASLPDSALPPSAIDHAKARPGPAPSAAPSLAPDRTLIAAPATPAPITIAPPLDRWPSPALRPDPALAWAPPRLTTAAPQAAELAMTIMPQIPAFAERLPERAPLRPAATELALLTQQQPPTTLSPLPPRLYQPFCPATYGSAAAAALGATEEPLAEGEPFGQRLAAAAAAQTAHFVIYDDKYRQIARAGGDVPALYGVCTDVIVRAYRSVGIDLQTLVQASRVGAGDPNIDHRRTETLRRYFARYGKSLPITAHGEDYQPGDIVTYWRPQNSGSRSHIAIVSATLGPSGRPMIIHNRGWGPQLEDGLFVDRVTGHYRYDGGSRPPLPPQLVTTPARPFSPASAAMPATLRAADTAVPGAAGL